MPVHSWEVADTSEMTGDLHLAAVVINVTHVDEWPYPDGADFIVMRDPDGNEFCAVNHPEP